MGVKYDVAIVGAGPAGSSAAIRLALGGRRVVLIEKEKFPRSKLCGEFISPECLDSFDELGILGALRAAGAVAIERTVFYGRSGKCVDVPSKWFGSTNGPALGLSRAEMDLRLLMRARDAGVDVFEGSTVIDVLRENGSVAGVKLSDRDISSTLTIDATGRARLLARRVDKSRARQRAEIVAFKTHIRGCGVPDDVCEIFSYSGGYGGSSRIENGLHNLCFIAAAADVKRLGSDPARVLREIVCSNKRAAEVFVDISFAGEWHAVAIERFGRGKVAPARGLLCIGDSAAFVDPFTGSGILMALESARVAARAIIGSETFDKLAENYEQGFSSTFDRRLRMCSILRRVSVFPLLAETTLRSLALSSGLRRLVVRSTR